MKRKSLLFVIFGLLLTGCFFNGESDEKSTPTQSDVSQESISESEVPSSTSTTEITLPPIII